MRKDIFAPGNILALVADRNSFTRIYFMLCSLWFMPLLGSRVDILVKICFIWGILLIIRDIFTKRILFTSFSWVLLILFLCSYAVTIALHIDSGWYSNGKYLIYNSILLLLIYPQNGNVTKEELYKLLRIFNTIIISIAFIAGIVSLYMFFFHIGFRIKQGNSFLGQGLVSTRLFGVYTSPNVGALYGFLSILASIINYQWKTPYIKTRKILFLLNGIIQVSYLALSFSRGGYLTYSAGILLVFLFVGLPIILQLKNIRNILIWMALTVLLLSSSIVFVVKSPQSLFFPLMKSISTSFEHHTSSFIQPSYIAGIPSELSRNNSTLSSGRFDIWKDSIALWRHAPFFGLGNLRNLSTDFPELSNQAALEGTRGVTLLNNLHGNTHNVYLQVLVCSGLAGFLLLLIFASRLCIKFFSYLMNSSITDFSSKIIRLLICTIISLAVNGLVETHLLFNGQDPFSIFFWFYIGIAVLLIHAHQKELITAGKTPYYAFICDTPYQVLNAVNFIANNIEDSRNCSDIFVYKQFSKAEHIAGNLRESGLFQHVYEISAYDSRPVAYSKIRTLYRMLAPIASLKRYSDFKAYKDQPYSRLFISFSTHFTMNLHMYFRFVPVTMIEDGMSSYFGNTEIDSSSSIMKFFRTCIMNGAWDFKPETMYLNNPDICTTRMAEKLLPLPEYTQLNPALDYAKKIFSYKENSLYAEKKLVILTQPLEEVENYIPDSLERIFELLDNSCFNAHIVLRIHPRQHLLIKPFDTDSNNNLWELECMYTITSEHTLIGAYSTAMIMPKLLCNNEPNLIFTYKLSFSSLKNPYWKAVENFINQIQDLYSEKNKIFIPESFEELKHILKTLKVS